jgi:hypothetical protein
MPKQKFKMEKKKLSGALKATTVSTIAQVKNGSTTW